MKEYKEVKADGVAVVIIHKKRILLLKRRKLPFITNPGIWSFLTGGKNKDESYSEAAYRETEEETGIKKEQLKQIRKPIKAWLFDSKRRKKWQNYIFFFKSETNEVKLNMENAAFRWASITDIKNENEYTNISLDDEKILEILGACLK
jgi:ADP-ribose pyrophosphatase YjhB (NUDIX family)